MYYSIYPCLNKTAKLKKVSIEARKKTKNVSNPHDTLCFPHDGQDVYSPLFQHIRTNQDKVSDWSGHTVPIIFLPINEFTLSLINFNN